MPRIGKMNREDHSAGGARSNGSSALADTNGRANDSSRLPFWSALVLTGVITASSFVLSFTALWDLFTQVGQPRKISWLFAILLDGAILQATISVVWLADAPGQKGRSDRRFFWIVLIFSATASIFGNALHAYTNHSPDFDARLAAVIATIAPIALLFSSHGLTILARRSHPGLPTAVAEQFKDVVADNEKATPLLETTAAEMIETAQTGEIPTNPTPGDDNQSDEPSEPLVKKFATAEARREHALALNASGTPIAQITVAVDRSASTIYRWIEEAKDSRPLVPQGRQLANAG